MYSLAYRVISLLVPRLVLLVLVLLLVPLLLEERLRVEVRQPYSNKLFKNLHSRQATSQQLSDREND